MKYLFLLFLIGCNSGVDKLNKKEVKTTQLETKAAVRVSHRGFNQNKINGFLDAIEAGFTDLETDVRLRNGKPVLLHDNIDCVDCDDLEELLILAQIKNVKLWIEFKDIESVDKSLELISNYNIDVVLFSFHLDILLKLNAESNYSIGYVNYNNDHLNDVSSFIDWFIIEKNKAHLCVKNIKCAVWTTKTKDDELLFANVDAVITDVH